MNGFAKHLFFLCLLALLPVSSFADELVSLKAGYMVLSPSGVFAGEDDSLEADRIDLEGDLDFNDSQDLMVEAALSLGRFRLGAAYAPLNFAGSGTLTNGIRFNGQDFGAGTTVNSEVDAKLYDIGLTFFLLNFDDLPVRLQLGAELAAKIVDGEAQVENPDTGLKGEVSGTAGVPTVGLRARAALADFLGVVGRVGYMAVSGNSFLDVDAQVEFSPIPLVGLFAGYRLIDIDVDEADLVLDAQFAGPYGGVLVRF